MDDPATAATAIAAAPAKMAIHRDLIFRGISAVLISVARVDLHSETNESRGTHAEKPPNERIMDPLSYPPIGGGGMAPVNEEQPWAPRFHAMWEEWCFTLKECRSSWQEVPVAGVL
ncbi:hypothetical protein [Streptomyces wuyuanensis]|uniref:hypothetical protein n=1 Tax=Streptomyces wuyuanensis TaxID=1196353 RepID=UPI0034452285